MCELGLEETWTEKSFYEQPLSIWNFFENKLDQPADLPMSMDIFTASSIGEVDYVNFLLTKYSDYYNASSVNKSYWSAMMYAVHCSKENIVRLLLENGASVHTCNKKGQNVLMMAARWGYENLVECFIKCGSQIEARDLEDWTALFHAVAYDKFEVAQTLLKYRANPCACIRNSGKTPLMYAAQNGNCAMVELLLRAGAFPNFVSLSGENAERIALDAGHQRVAAFLSQWKIKEGPSLLEGPSAIEHRMALQHVRGHKIHPGTYDASLKTPLPSDLESFLLQLGLKSFVPLFKEQQVDMVVFLSLSDKDLQECGVTALGPRRKMTDAISRWHSNALPRKGVEGAYALKLEMEVQKLKAEVSDYEKNAKEMKRRLEECNKVSTKVRDHLSSAYRFAAVFSVQQLAEDLKMISVYLDDIFRWSDVSSRIKK